MNLLLLFIIILIGGMIQGTTGFGFAIIAMAIMPFFIPFKESAIIVMLLGFTMSVQLCWRMRKHINYKVLIPTVLACLAGRSIGVYALVKLSSDVLKMSLGIILILLSIYLAFYNNRIKIKANSRNGIIAGLLSGILGGMFNVSGPPLVIYYYSAIDDKMDYNGTIQATYVISSIYTLILHIILGNITLNIVKMASFGAVAITIGCTFGLWIFKRISKETLSRVIYSFMAAMGIFLITKR